MLVLSRRLCSPAIPFILPSVFVIRDASPSNHFKRATSAADSGDGGITTTGGIYV